MEPDLAQNIEDTERAIDHEWAIRNADLLHVALGFPLADFVESDDRG